MRRLALYATLSLSLLAAACTGSSSSSLPTAPSGPTTTETFTGTIPVGGSDFHTFNVSQAGGTTTISLTAAGPPSTIWMFVDVGNVAGSICTPFNTTLAQASTVTPVVSGTLFNTGTLCLQIRDAGNQTSPVTYSVSITHF